MGLSTRLHSLLRGKLVGRDISGNRYYLEKSPRRGMRVRRWVLYAGPTEASAVPPEWDGWLHYTTDTPSPNTARHPWQRARVPNATGSPSSYRPPGHDYNGGHRPAADGDYEAWAPEIVGDA